MKNIAFTVRYFVLNTKNLPPKIQIIDYLFIKTLLKLKLSECF